MLVTCITRTYKRTNKIGSNWYVDSNNTAEIEFDKEYLYQARLDIVTIKQVVNDIVEYGVTLSSVILTPDRISGEIYVHFDNKISYTYNYKTSEINCKTLIQNI